MKFTGSEWQIMNVLWEHHPATAREIKESLPKDNQWAYTTIKTLLSRLVAKNALDEQKRGNTSIYKPLVSRQKARRFAVRSFLNQSFEGAVEPFLHFLVKDKKLSQKQRKELIKILEKEDQKRGGEK